MKIRPVGALLFHAGVRDGQTDMKKLTATSRNFANAPNNQSVNISQVCNGYLFREPYKTHN